MDQREQDDVRTAVREQYGAIARGEAKSCCGTNCCDASAKLGYADDELAGVPEGANMGLGCGNPGAIAALRAGEVVLDLGAGGGFDCFLAARQVGSSGRVIGVDMTADMVRKARANAATLGTRNVEFRLGEIEHLPVVDVSIDVILSNCVINLSPDKEAVFREAFRVLKPAGRLAISDVVALSPVPAELATQLSAYTGCIAGAVEVDALRSVLESVGFADVTVEVDAKSASFIRDWLPGSNAERYIAAATIRAVRPEGKACCGTACCAPEATA